MTDYKVLVTYSVHIRSREHRTLVSVLAENETEAELVAAQMVAARGLWVTDTELVRERNTK